MRYSKNIISLIQRDNFFSSKQKKWGIKFWALADAHTGYIYKIKCYTGRQANADKIGKFGLGYDVVCDLTSGMDNKGYHLYIDNYYTRFLC